MTSITLNLSKFLNSQAKNLCHKFKATVFLKASCTTVMFEKQNRLTNIFGIKCMTHSARNRLTRK